jgi:hypothetical protein
MDVENLMNYFERPPQYRSYLITMWQERSQNEDVPVVWRFRIEDPHTGKRRGFADLKTLVAALEKEMAEPE